MENENAETEIKSNITDAETVIKSNITDAQTDIKSNITDAETDIKSNITDAETVIKSDDSDAYLVKEVKKVIDESIESVLGGFKASVFARAFPGLVNKTKLEAYLEKLRLQIVQSLETSMHNDLSAFIGEELEGRLIELSSLLTHSLAREGEVAWRPSGNVEEDLRSHKVKILEYERQKLKTDLDTFRSEREKLFKQVQDGRKECEENDRKICQRIAEGESVLAACDSIPVNDLVKDIDKAISSSILDEL